MKKLLAASALFVMIGISVPASAFIDGELFGGYNFQGSYTTDIKTVSVTGINYGGRVHLNGGLLGIASYGVGIFGENTPLKYSQTGASYNLQKTDIGPDVYVRLGIIPVLKPYVRTGFSFYEYTKDNYGNKSNEGSQNPHNFRF